MANEIWFNLPVKNVKKSKEFFTNLGFSFNTKYDGNDQHASLMVGTKNIIIMLFEESMFQDFIKNNITDTNQSNEVLISFDAESKEEVDEMARKVEAAGGTIFGKPAEIQGWMYGCGFTDLDGHRWNPLYMDMNKMPKGQ